MIFFPPVIITCALFLLYTCLKPSELVSNVKSYVISSFPAVFASDPYQRESYTRTIDIPVDTPVDPPVDSNRLQLISQTKIDEPICGYHNDDTNFVRVYVDPLGNHNDLPAGRELICERPWNTSTGNKVEVDFWTQIAHTYGASRDFVADTIADASYIEIAGIIIVALGFLIGLVWLAEDSSEIRTPSEDNDQDKGSKQEQEETYSILLEDQQESSHKGKNTIGSTKDKNVAKGDCVEKDSEDQKWLDEITGLTQILADAPELVDIQETFKFDIGELEETLEEMESVNPSKLTRLEDERKSLKGQNISKSHKIEELEKKQATHEQKLAENQNEIAELTDANDVLKGDFEKRELEHSQLMKNNEIPNQEIIKLKENKDILEKSIAKQTQDFNNMQKYYEEKVSISNGQSVEMKARLETQGKELVAEQQKNEELSEQMKHLQADDYTQRHMIVALKDQVKELEQLNSELQGAQEHHISHQVSQEVSISRAERETSVEPGVDATESVQSGIASLESDTAENHDNTELNPIDLDKSESKPEDSESTASQETLSISSSMETISEVREGLISEDTIGDISAETENEENVKVMVKSTPSKSKKTGIPTLKRMSASVERSDISSSTKKEKKGSR